MSQFYLWVKTVRLSLVFLLFGGISLGVFSPLYASPETSPASTPNTPLLSPSSSFDQDPHFKEAHTSYTQRTRLTHHKKAFAGFYQVAKKYPKALKAQLWCMRTSYYLGHRLRDTESKKMKSIFFKGMDCRKRVLKYHAQNEEAQIWAILMQFKHLIATSTLPPLGRIEKVAKKLEKMVKKGSKSHFPYMMLGAIYRELPGWPLSIGDEKKAMKYLKQGRKWAGQNAEYLLEVAATHKALDEEEQARKVYQMCINKGTGHPDFQWEAEDARKWAKKMLAELD